MGAAAPAKNGSISVQKSVRKCVMLSVLLQYVHLLSGFIFIFFSHSLQGNVLCISLCWNAFIEMCQLHMNGILKIIFQKLQSLDLTFV